MAAEKNFENRLRAWLHNLLMCVNGIFIAAELKSSVGKPTELQRKNIEMVNRGGGICF